MTTPDYRNALLPPPPPFAQTAPTLLMPATGVGLTAVDEVALNKRRISSVEEGCTSPDVV